MPSLGTDSNFARPGAGPHVFHHSRAPLTRRKRLAASLRRNATTNPTLVAVRDTRHHVPRSHPSPTPPKPQAGLRAGRGASRHTYPER
jgi:hypothetical protein